MALAEPLEFVGRFDGDDIGMFAKVCLWRNAYVLLRVDYCSGVAALGIPGAPEAWVMGSMIYSPRGEEVSLYAEVQPPTSVYTAPRSAYTMFKVEYQDYSAAGGFHLGLDVDGYAAFIQAANALPFGSYPVCYEDFELVTRQEGNTEVTTTRNLGRARCAHSPRDLEKAWTRVATLYLRDPPELWFTYLDAIKALVAEGKNKGSPNMLVHLKWADIGRSYVDAAAAQQEHGDECSSIVETKGASGDRACFAVEAFDPAVVQSGLDVGEDPIAVLADGASQLDEREGAWSAMPRRATRRAWRRPR